jgi:hypothetical protein
MGVAKESDKQKKKEEHRERDDKLHDALEDSFPASDPLSLSQIRSAHNSDVVRRGSMAEECFRRPGRIGGGVSPWPATDVFGHHCSNARKSAAHDADAARQL